MRGVQLNPVKPGGCRHPFPKLGEEAVVLDDHVAMRFERGAVDHHVAADRKPGAGGCELSVGLNQLTARRAMSAGQMLARSGLGDPVRQRDPDSLGAGPCGRRGACRPHDQTACRPPGCDGPTRSIGTSARRTNCSTRLQSTFSSQLRCQSPTTGSGLSSCAGCWWHSSTRCGRTPRSPALPRLAYCSASLESTSPS